MNKLDRIALNSLKRSHSRQAALADFVERIKDNKVLIAILAEPYLDQIAGGLSAAGVESSRNAMLPANPNGAPWDDDTNVSLVALAPSLTKRGLSAIAYAQRAIGKSIFDRFLLPDGTPIGNVRYYQLNGEIRAYGTVARVLDAVRRHGTPSDQNARVRDLVSAEWLEEVITQEEKLIVA